MKLLKIAKSNYKEKLQRLYERQISPEDETDISYESWLVKLERPFEFLNKHPKISFEDIHDSKEPKKVRKTEEEMLLDIQKEFLSKLHALFPQVEDLLYLITKYNSKYGIQYFMEVGKIVEDVRSLYNILEFWKRNGEKIIQSELDSLKPNIEE